jgi:hypothetical protein
VIARVEREGGEARRAATRCGAASRVATSGGAATSPGVRVRDWATTALDSPLHRCYCYYCCCCC